MFSNKVNKIQTNIINYIKTKKTFLVLITKVGVAMLLLGLLSTNSMTCIIDFIVLLIGALFLCYFILFGYKHLL